MEPGPRGPPGPTGPRQGGEPRALRSGRRRRRARRTRGGLSGGARARPRGVPGQARGAAPQTGCARSEFAGRFPADSHERSAQTGIGLGRTLVRIGRRWAAPGTGLVPGAEGPFSLGARRGPPENAPRGRGPAGGPGAGEPSRSRVEGGPGAGRRAPTLGAAGAPRAAASPCGGTEVSLAPRRGRGCEGHRRRRGGRGPRGAGLRVAQGEAPGHRTPDSEG